MKSQSMLRISVGTLALALLGVGALYAQSKDKNTVQVPGGLAFAEFKGYESWQIDLHQPERHG